MKNRYSMKTIKEILMDRDGMTEDEADIVISEANEQLKKLVPQLGRYLGGNDGKYHSSWRLVLCGAYEIDGRDTNGFPKGLHGQNSAGWAVTSSQYSADEALVSRYADIDLSRPLPVDKEQKMKTMRTRTPRSRDDIRYAVFQILSEIIKDSTRSDIDRATASYLMMYDEGTATEYAREEPLYDSLLGEWQGLRDVPRPCYYNYLTAEKLMDDYGIDEGKADKYIGVVDDEVIDRVIDFQKKFKMTHSIRNVQTCLH